jgi:hypothetical protein
MQKHILKYFCEMNVEMLELVLDDSKTYQDVSKDLFLKKLDSLFERFKDRKDDSLISFPGSCSTGGCNKGCTGFGFVGNQSNGHTAFIFDGDETQVNDIYICNSFYSERKDLLMNDFMGFDFADDEAASFKPSIEYLLQQQQCERACSEIVKDQPKYLFTVDYLHWVNQYRPLYRSLPDVFTGHNYKKFDQFNRLFSVMNQLVLIYGKESKAKRMLEAYKLIDKDSETEIIQWLLNYELFCDKLMKEVCGNMFTGTADWEGFIELTQLPSIKVEIAAISNAVEAGFLYQKHYWPMLKKHAAFPIDDGKLDWRSEAFEKRYSLKYHLNFQPIVK